MFQDRQAFAPGMNCYVPAMQYWSGCNRTWAYAVRSRYSCYCWCDCYADQCSGCSWTDLVPSVTDYHRCTLWQDHLGHSVRCSWQCERCSDVIGYDYLGQPMFERFTGAAAAATPLVGLKALEVGFSAQGSTSAATNAVTISIYYRCQSWSPVQGQDHGGDGRHHDMTYAQINTNTVDAVLTDPADCATGDPRGLYTPTTAPNGVLSYESVMNGDPSVNAAGNGGLHGIRQFGF